jgi:hypothetical protein
MYEWRFLGKGKKVGVFITAGVRLSSGRAGVVQKLGAFSRVSSAVVGRSEEVGWRQDINGGAR